MKRTIQCEHEQCQKKFQYESHYIRHLTTHDDSRPFSCSVCSKLFKRPDALRNHERTHFENEENQFNCTHEGCEQKFPSKAGLRYHMLKQHEKSTEHICDHPNCGKSFTTLGQLKQHLKTKVHAKQTGITINYNLKTEENNNLMQQQESKTEIVDTLWNQLKNMKSVAKDQKLYQKQEEQCKKYFVSNLKDKSPIDAFQSELTVVLGLVNKINDLEKDESKQMMQTVSTIFASENGYCKSIFQDVLTKQEMEEEQQESTTRELNFEFEETLPEVNLQQQESKIFDKDEFKFFDELSETKDKDNFDIFETGFNLQQDDNLIFGFRGIM